MQQVKAHETTRPSSDLMKQILEMADFVKFAKVRPLPDDNVKSFSMATRFVEDTKPTPQPEETPDSSSAADASKPGDKEHPNPKTTK
jgi:hypothetical protein